MDMSKKISIIVAAYNEEKHIDECLESLVGQTYKNLEIIMVDDGSNDSTVSKIEKFAENDSRIKIVKQENAGLASARNSGLKIATGDYIGFSDADDYIELNMYEKLIKNMQKENADIVCCSFRAINSAGKIGKSYKLADKPFKINIKKDSLKYYDLFINGVNGIYSVCNKLYDNKILIEKGVRFYPNKRFGEDVDFNLKYSQYANCFSFIPDLLYNYRMTEQSITRGYIKNALERHLIWIDSMMTYLPWIKTDSSRMLKLRKLSAENIIFAISQEVIYIESVNIANYIKKVLKINEYKMAYREISPKMLSSKSDRVLWKLLKAKKYKLLIIAIKLRHKIINIKNNGLL